MGVESGDQVRARLGTRISFDGSKREINCLWEWAVGLSFLLARREWKRKKATKEWDMILRGTSKHMLSFAIAGMTLVIVVSSQAADRSWQTPGGSSPGNTFNYSGGQSGDDGLNLINGGTLNPEGLWGEPTVTATGFNFNNIRAEFQAVAINGGSDARQSEMDVNIVPTGQAFNELHVLETGTWSGDLSALQSSTASVEIFQPSPLIFPTTFPSLPISFNLDGTWELQFDINDFSAQFGVPFTNVFLSVTNILNSNPAMGDASITKTGVRVDFPEPGTIGLIILGAIPVVTRRRRKVAQHS